MTPALHPNDETRSAQAITKFAKSNLALTLRLLPKQRRKDLVTFYAFCRVIDDLADDEKLTPAEKTEGLDNWTDFIKNGKQEEAKGLARELLEIKSRHHIADQHFFDLIAGCRSDLQAAQRFGTWDQKGTDDSDSDHCLSTYTYRVACAVGLICLPLFGVANPSQNDCQQYAISLGHALQLTNIIRDVGTDLDNGHRIYLPLADLLRFQYTERDIIGRVYDGRFVHLMAYEAERAKHYYAEAEAAFQRLTKQDQKALLPSRAMHRIYRDLLEKMETEQFRVFHQEYRLSKFQKIMHLAKAYFE